MGCHKSSVGKALFYFSLGLITWGFGEMIWSYYNIFLKIEVPYPSFADLAFILSWPLWAIGLYYLSISTGFKYGVRTKTGKMILFVIPVITLIFSYYLLVVVARNGALITSSDTYKIFFDLAYPLFDVILLIESLLIFGLSSKYTQLRYKWPLGIILGGIVLNYFADFIFSYTTTNGTFYNGSSGDLLFVTSMYLISVGVNSFEVS